jgi:serine/threonine protein phosphatase 1
VCIGSKTKDNPLWYKHGGEATVLAYEDVDENTKQHINFLLLEDYHLDEKRTVLYTGFTNMNGVKYEFYQNYFIGIELWETALAEPTSNPMTVPQTA